MNLFDLAQKISELRKKVRGNDEFDTQCLSLFGFGRKRAYQVLKYDALCENLVYSGRLKKSLLPPERILRPLLKLSAEQQKTAWNQVLSICPSGQVTRAHVVWAIEQIKKDVRPDKFSLGYLGTVPKLRIDPDFVRALDTEAEYLETTPEAVLHRVLDRYFSGRFDMLKRRKHNKDKDMVANEEVRQAEEPVTVST
jgi:hypothetical protein